MRKDNEKILTVKELKNILANISDDMPIVTCMVDTGVFYLSTLAVLHCDFEDDKDTLCFYANDSKDKSLTIKDETSCLERILWDYQKGANDEG